MRPAVAAAVLNRLVFELPFQSSWISLDDTLEIKNSAPFLCYQSHKRVFQAGTNVSILALQCQCCRGSFENWCLDLSHRFLPFRRSRYFHFTKLKIQTESCCISNGILLLTGVAELVTATSVKRCSLVRVLQLVLLGKILTKSNTKCRHFIFVAS